MVLSFIHGHIQVYTKDSECANHYMNSYFQISVMYINLFTHTRADTYIHTINLTEILVSVYRIKEFSSNAFYVIKYSFLPVQLFYLFKYILYLKYIHLKVLFLLIHNLKIRYYFSDNVRCQLLTKRLKHIQYPRYINKYLTIFLRLITRPNRRFYESITGILKLQPILRTFRVHIIIVQVR